MKADNGSQADQAAVSKAAAELGRKGGRVKSEAKARAARANGKRGGGKAGAAGLKQLIREYLERQTPEE